MRYLYTIIFYLLLPFILFRLWIKNRKNPRALKFWHERLGIGMRQAPKQGIWVHAVSVGESIAAISLIKGLQQQYPTIPIIVTSETASGADRIRVGLGNSVTQLYAPYDLPLVLKKFFNTLRPRMLILMETELWPNILAKCRKNKVPVVVANARLSAQSARGYRCIRTVTQEMLGGINLIIAQAQADADRFIELGFPCARMQITGSIKVDLEVPHNLAAQAEQLREQWGKDRFIWIAASTHEGEEEQILNAFTLIRKKLMDVILVSVPRHIDRVPHLESLYQSQGYKTVKCSENKYGSNADIFIGDSMGELLTFYAAADLAFVGGSLVERGGQNPLEPAAVGLPILTGPHTFNFALITDQLKKRGVEIQVNNAQELAEQVVTLFSDLQRRQEIGLEAKKFMEENKGSVSKHLELIAQLININ
ncbi:MAG: lipid IV(A) 3-deoxy-D-manno-octulosonic acid transferase [Rickettsiella sp.]|nr:lipid IV(A) 3-deoxy-D-manno-octulosonic acid transferase [Rickettsiella sp.]